MTDIRIQETTGAPMLSIHAPHPDADQLGRGWSVLPQPPGRALVTLRMVEGRMVADYDPADLDEAARIFWDSITKTIPGAGARERVGYQSAVATLLDVADRSGSPAARWAAEYLAADPDKRGPAPDVPAPAAAGDVDQDDDTAMICTVTPTVM